MTPIDRLYPAANLAALGRIPQVAPNETRPMTMTVARATFGGKDSVQISQEALALLATEQTGLAKPST